MTAEISASFGAATTRRRGCKYVTSAFGVTHKRTYVHASALAGVGESHGKFAVSLKFYFSNHFFPIAFVASREGKWSNGCVNLRIGSISVTHFTRLVVH